MPTESDIIIHPDVAKQLAEATIKKDITKALVELITNCDDSYRRLEKRGINNSGNIIIEFVRKRTSPSIFRVIDNAEGIDDVKMDDVVKTIGRDLGSIGKDSNVRGYYNRGLKQSIMGLGDGKIISIRDNNIYESALYYDKKRRTYRYRKEDTKRLTNAIKKQYSKICPTGTIIEIVINKEGVSTPQFETLVFNISRYFSLRDILSSRKRNVNLRELDGKGKLKNRQQLQYKQPVGDVLLLKEDLQIQGYPEAKYNIALYKAKFDLSHDGPGSEGGLLVKSKNAIHDITLFGFEENTYAQKLYGNIECFYIDTLLSKEESIISDRRDGLDLAHPFCKALTNSIQVELKQIIEIIKKEEEKKRKTIESEKTKKRILSAIQKINEIAKSELGEEGEGPTKKGGGETEHKPKDGFNFVPDFYNVEAGKRKTLSLKAVVPWIVKDGGKILITSDCEDVVVESGIFTADEKNAKNGVLTINPVIYSKSAGAEAIVTAISGECKTEAYIEVVSEIKRKDKEDKKDKGGKEGLCNNISFDSSLSPQIRQRFDRDTKIVRISTQNPSVAKYLGLNGEGQDEIHSRVLIAELVTEAICRELTRLKADRGLIKSPGGITIDVLTRERDALISKYAYDIHNIWVDSKK